MQLCRSSSNVPRLPSFCTCNQTLRVCSFLARCRIHCACHAQPQPNFKNWLSRVLCAAATCTFRTCSAFTILTWKRASRHNGVEFLNISTYKSAPDPRCFCNFNFDSCFPPQSRALFSTAQRAKVFRHRSALYILTWKCASRHNGVHIFDISTFKSGPNVRCF